jgi:hypothetical protein
MYKILNLKVKKLTSGAMVSCSFLQLSHPPAFYARQLGKHLNFDGDGTSEAILDALQEPILRISVSAESFSFILLILYLIDYI